MWCLWCVWCAVLGAALGGGGARASELTPRPACPPEHHQSCVSIYNHGQSYAFNVNGQYVAYRLTDDGIFTLNCPRTITLEEPALPRYKPALRVRGVRLHGCWPRAVSCAAALRALNVTALDAPRPEGAPAVPRSFLELQLSNLINFNASMLGDMSTLRNLSIFFTTVTTADLALLPAGLERLVLYEATGNVPANVLARLSSLRELEVGDSELVVVELEAAPNLSSLVASSPATRVSLSLPDTLEWLELKGWAPRRPEPWRSCVGLESLSLSSVAVETLPDGWLARCARLRTLSLDETESLTSLAAGVLRGATALQEVRFKRGALEALPAGLLDDARALRMLDLSSNRLHTLHGELFRRSKSLRALNLSYNNLTSSVLGSLETVSSLSELVLDYNLALDACPLARDAEHGAMQGLSSLRALRNLTRLSLAGTDTQRVCPDWRQLPRLEWLDLTSTDVTQFEYTDLQFNSSVNMTLVLPHIDSSLRRVDYDSFAAAPKGPTLTLQTQWLLHCDCKLYWTVAALRLPNTRLHVGNVGCTNDRWLVDVSLDELVCAVPDHCPTGCACGWREDVERAGGMLRVDCTGARLFRVPRVDTRAALRSTESEPVELDLRLAGNRISQLAPEDFSPELLTLDLRNNMLSDIDAATVTALVSRAGRRVSLADNPLECDCRAAAVFTAMREHPDVFRDRDNVTCSNGTRLTLVAPHPCDDGTGDPRNVTESEPKDVSGGMSGGAVTTVVLGVAAATAVLVLVLARVVLRRRRARLPSILRLERLDAGVWLYDAFISFAHADWAVVHELVEELESGAAPLRLCVHYRDWVPGSWIPAQIAESVRVSHRTVAVVSEAFLRSKWARAEFREAYAAALEDNEPRLVLVLLEDPARLQLDSELRAYVTGNTYVRWDDPWFWRKLRSALPVPLPRQPSTAPTSPSPSLPPTSPSPPPDESESPADESKSPADESKSPVGSGTSAVVRLSHGLATPDLISIRVRTKINDARDVSVLQD